MRSNSVTVVVCVALLSVASAGGVIGATLSQDDAATARDGELPPGVTEDGVENATALVEAHTTTVNESGFVYETHTSYNLSSVGMQAESTDTGVVSPGLSTFRTHSTGTVTIENCTIDYDVEQWGNDSLALNRYEIGNQTQYAKQNLTQPSEADETSALAPSSSELVDAGLSQSLLLAGVLQSGNFTVAETSTVDDRTLTTLRADELNESLVRQLGAGNISHYDATITVDQTGLVHSLTVDAIAERGDQQFRLHHAFDVLALGPDAPLQPTWTPTALDTVSAAIFVDDAEDHFEIANQRGDTVPANTTLELTHENATHNLTLDEELAPGEAVHVYYPANESAPVLAREPPANATAQELSGEYNFAVRTPADQVLVSVEYEIGDGTSASFSGGMIDPFSGCEEFDRGTFAGMTSPGSEERRR